MDIATAREIVKQAAEHSFKGTLAEFCKAAKLVAEEDKVKAYQSDGRLEELKKLIP